MTAATNRERVGNADPMPSTLEENKHSISNIHTH